MTILDSSVPVFLLDSAYVLGTPLVSSATFNGTTLAANGFNTPGQLGSWTLTGTSETITLCVANPGTPCGTPVPGPLPLLGASVAFGWTRQLRRRISQAGSRNLARR
jgi:hypothetical protein